MERNVFLLDALPLHFDFYWKKTEACSRNQIPPDPSDQKFSSILVFPCALKKAGRPNFCYMRIIHLYQFHQYITLLVCVLSINYPCQDLVDFFELLFTPSTVCTLRILNSFQHVVFCLVTWIGYMTGFSEFQRYLVWPLQNNCTFLC